MNKIELDSLAKVNLSIDVLRKRPDGYHDIKMIMQTISIQDKISIEIDSSNGIQVRCNSMFVPSNSENIAYKAANLIMNKFKLKCGVKIIIDKSIPVSAGLGGGSSNAATVLKGMNQLLALKLNDSQLEALGKEIGADVPFFIKGGTMLAEGIGEILTKLNRSPKMDILLVKPKEGVSTPWVYRNLDVGKIIDRPDTDLLIDAINNQDTCKIACNMKNVLEHVTIAKFPVIQEIKYKLMELGAIGSIMSGSGTTVFGVFKSREAIDKAYSEMIDTRWNLFITQTV